jgi:hypothetical protein
MPAYNLEDKDTQYAYECIRSFFDHFVIDDAVGQYCAYTKKKLVSFILPCIYTNGITN